MTHSKINIGIGACVAGQPVRYNGDHKRKHSTVEALKPYVEFKPFCPEMGIGLGVPREPVRIVLENDQHRLKDSNTQQHDYTDDIVNFADSIEAKLASISGYVLVKGSPSCGLLRVSRYTEKGNHRDVDGVGVFTEQLQRRFPLLPLEEDGRLHDPQLRERFITKVYTYHAWQQLTQKGVSVKRIIDFWAQHKYLVMSRHYASYKKIGRLLADAGLHPIDTVAQEFIELVMGALDKVPNRKGHTNVLQHIKGYLKNQLSKDESRDIDERIEQYRQEIVPLVVPMALLEHQFKRHPNDYINQQVFMSPYPVELGLRNSL